MSAATTIVWFRHDLRLDDNPAIHEAAQRGCPVVPLFIFAPHEEGPWPPGGASRWWLHHSLASLERDLRAIGSRLIIRTGDSREILNALVRETGANSVFWNRRYEPAIRSRDEAIKAGFTAEGVAARSFNSALLFEPWTIQTGTGRPFQVFTPFWRKCLQQAAPTEPFPAPKRLAAPKPWPSSLPLAQLGLLPSVNWASGISSTWQPGSAGAQARLACFTESACEFYSVKRDVPGEPGTSRLSPHLHFGEISPRRIWFSVRELEEKVRPGSSPGNSRFLSELGWREFSHHLLYHFPSMDHAPIRKEFERFKWRKNAGLLHTWQQGRTGYPLVDAGMRELWRTGWMHNRVRMVAASFLVKHLLIDWKQGSKWFWDTLVDADLAQNSMGWQWVAGCGADAAPFFRIFNPVLQGEKFDPSGSYVRRWVPELSSLPDKWIHCPWKAPQNVLDSSGVAIGQTYPEPIINHAIAREVAMETYTAMRE